MLIHVNIKHQALKFSCEFLNIYFMLAPINTFAAKCIDLGVDGHYLLCKYAICNMNYYYPENRYFKNIW